MTYIFENANQALIGLSQAIIANGYWQKVRGFDCLAIQHPVLVEITNPWDRCITLPQRKWNKTLPFAESLWLACGLNNLTVLPNHYCSTLANYSDDSTTWRAGYGPRIRSYTGISTDYKVSEPAFGKTDIPNYSSISAVDQLRYVVLSLQRDKYTRQAIMSLGDPVKDDFNDKGQLKVTKDYPCTRSIHFKVINEKLDCIVHMRSNDILFGFSGVNVFNFTWMQEYIANILGLPLGKYYQIIDDLHLYADKLEVIKEIAATDISLYKTSSPFQYRDHINSLTDFNHLIIGLYNYEQALFTGTHRDYMPFGNDMFDDWARIFYKFWIPEDRSKFNNPYLNKLYNI
jgi:thymidylate synthase